MKNLILSSAIALCIFGSTACHSTGSGSGLKPIEEMSDVEYSKWQLYIHLGVKVGANRLILEKVISKEDLLKIASVIDGIRDNTLTNAGGSLLAPALQKAGFTQTEVELLFTVVEQELIARGGLKWVDPATGTLALSPRTKSLLTVIASALKTAGQIEAIEEVGAKSLEAEFNGKIVK